ncbi:MAG: glycosyltransferase [Bacteroidales bacterium]|nr:glycosyltransferase [Bacteroidales bacterium]
MLIKRIKEFIDITIFYLVTNNEDLTEVLDKINEHYKINCFELVLMLETSELKNEALELVKKYPFIDLKIILSDNENPINISFVAKNIGKYSSKKNVCFCQSVPSVDALVNARILLKQEKKSIVKIIDSSDFYNGRSSVEELNITGNFDAEWSFLFRKKDVLLVEDEIYNESNFILCLTNIERRLHLSNYKTFIHTSNNVYLNTKTKIQIQKVNTEKLKEIVYPQKKSGNNIRLDQEIIKLIYPTETYLVKKEQCNTYLNSFSKSSLQLASLDKNYRALALVPAYNEIERIESFLEHIKDHCDGVILLDDGSSDSTYTSANHDIIKLKVSKKRTEFNDLENRNILLKLASFFNCEWFYFIDVDERFDERFDTVFDYVDNSKIDTIAFNFVNLWNNESQYRTDMFDTNRTMLSGVFYRWRMFRNVGNLQLYSDNKLHFSTTPYVNNELHSGIVLKHFGYLDKQKREKKYSFYKKEDKQEILDYEFILDNTIELENVSNLEQSNINSLIS